MTGPDFRDLVGDDLPEEEAARLRRAHELLIAAGPPPELSPGLEQPPSLHDEVVVPFLPRRRRGRGIGLAVAVGVLAFMFGSLWGTERHDFDADRTVQMRGVGEHRSALATIEIGDESAENIPMVVRVRGLPPLEGPRSYYELVITSKGEQIASCGYFETKPGALTEVRLSVPYRLGKDQDWYDGWVVVRHTRGSDATPVVMTT